MPAVAITPILVSAAVGAVGAAVSGGNILKGALMGAVGGALGGVISGAVGGAAGQAAGALGSQAMSGAFGGGDAAAAGSAGGDFAGDASAMGYGGSPDAAGAAGADTMGMRGGAPEVNPATGAVGNGVQAATTGALGGVAPSDTSLAASSVVPPNPFAGGSGGPKTFLESLFDSGKSMINSRLGVQLAGNALQGWAQGRNEQAKIDARRAELEDARRNARFGNVGSRYNTAGMIGPATYK